MTWFISKTGPLLPCGIEIREGRGTLCPEGTCAAVGFRASPLATRRGSLLWRPGENTPGAQSAFLKYVGEFLHVSPPESECGAGCAGLENAIVFLPFHLQTHLRFAAETFGTTVVLPGIDTLKLTGSV